MARVGGGKGRGRTAAPFSAGGEERRGGDERDRRQGRLSPLVRRAGGRCLARLPPGGCLLSAGASARVPAERDGFSSPAPAAPPAPMAGYTPRFTPAAYYYADELDYLQAYEDVLERYKGKSASAGLS